MKVIVAAVADIIAYRVPDIPEPAEARLILGIDSHTKRPVGRPPGKKSDPAYTQTGFYVRHSVLREVKRLLLDDPDRRDVSDLVGELLVRWLAENGVRVQEG